MDSQVFKCPDLTAGSALAAVHKRHLQGKMDRPERLTQGSMDGIGWLD